MTFEVLGMTFEVLGMTFEVLGMSFEVLGMSFEVLGMTFGVLRMSFLFVGVSFLCLKVILGFGDGWWDFRKVGLWGRAGFWGRAFLAISIPSKTSYNHIEQFWCQMACTDAGRAISVNKCHPLDSPQIYSKK